ncbi:hypothetical protein NPIL_353091 [Nephila pilipes]|uniref:Uncharacterized protein n=1 Tax=Nephila pilipes TaxID=299642 RepID=A0A8X6PM54_NEPPI|nr:hypothetical protein NPIL_353091 [Nephila pilipes]
MFRVEQVDKFFSTHRLLVLSTSLSPHPPSETYPPPADSLSLPRTLSPPTDSLSLHPPPSLTLHQTSYLSTHHRSLISFDCYLPTHHRRSHLTHRLLSPARQRHVRRSSMSPALVRSFHRASLMVHCLAAPTADFHHGLVVSPRRGLISPTGLSIAPAAVYLHHGFVVSRATAQRSYLITGLVVPHLRGLVSPSDSLSPPPRRSFSPPDSLFSVTPSTAVLVSPDSGLSPYREYLVSDRGSLSPRLPRSCLHRIFVSPHPTTRCLVLTTDSLSSRHPAVLSHHGLFISRSAPRLISPVLVSRRPVLSHLTSQDSCLCLTRYSRIVISPRAVLSPLRSCSRRHYAITDRSPWVLSSTVFLLPAHRVFFSTPESFSHRCPPRSCLAPRTRLISHTPRSGSSRTRLVSCGLSISLSHPPPPVLVSPRTRCLPTHLPRSLISPQSLSAPCTTCAVLSLTADSLSLPHTTCRRSCLTTDSLSHPPPRSYLTYGSLSHTHHPAVLSLRTRYLHACRGLACLTHPDSCLSALPRSCLTADRFVSALAAAAVLSPAPDSLSPALHRRGLVSPGLVVSPPTALESCLFWTRYRHALTTAAVISPAVLCHPHHGLISPRTRYLPTHPLARSCLTTDMGYLPAPTTADSLSLTTAGQVLSPPDSLSPRPPAVLYLRHGLVVSAPTAAVLSPRSCLSHLPLPELVTPHPDRCLPCLAPRGEMSLTYGLFISHLPAAVLSPADVSLFLPRSCISPAWIVVSTRLPRSYLLHGLFVSPTCRLLSPLTRISSWHLSPRGYISAHARRAVLSRTGSLSSPSRRAAVLSHHGLRLYRRLRRGVLSHLPGFVVAPAAGLVSPAVRHLHLRRAVLSSLRIVLPPPRSYLLTDGRCLAPAGSNLSLQDILSPLPRTAAQVLSPRHRRGLIYSPGLFISRRRIVNLTTDSLSHPPPHDGLVSPPDSLSPTHRRGLISLRIFLSLLLPQVLSADSRCLPSHPPPRSFIFPPRTRCLAPHRELSHRSLFLSHAPPPLSPADSCLYHPPHAVLSSAQDSVVSPAAAGLVSTGLFISPPTTAVLSPPRTRYLPTCTWSYLHHGLFIPPTGLICTAHLSPRTHHHRSLSLHHRLFISLHPPLC